MKKSLFLLTIAMLLIFSLTACDEIAKSSSDGISNEKTSEEITESEEITNGEETTSGEENTDCEETTSGEETTDSEETTSGEETTDGEGSPETPTTPSPTQGLKFEFNQDLVSYRLTGIGSAKGTDIVIPDTYNGLPVTAIGNSAFANCNTLKTIFVPEGIKEIGNSAFSNCTQLESVNLPNSLEWLGASAFYKCNNLEGTVDQGIRYQGNSQNPYLVLIRPRSIAIKECVSHKDTVFIASNAFKGCEDLKTLVLSDNVKSIGAAAFADCYALTSVTLPNSLEYIGENIFPESVKSAALLKDSAYYLGNDENPYLYLCCAESKEIISCTVAPGTKFIGANAFFGCKKLEQVKFSDEVREIHVDAFARCRALREIILPNSLQFIGFTAFRECSQLERVKFGDVLTTLDGAVFSDCPSLSEITIPDSVTSIGSLAFSGCTNLTIYCEATAKPSGWASDWNPDNRSVVWNCQPQT